MVKRNDHVSIDMKKLADSITVARQKLTTLNEKCSIYAVPPKYRMSKKSLYTPKVVSIGPLHHGKKEFEVMEEHKLRFLNEFMKRTQVSIYEFLKFIEHKEVELRDRYADTIKYECESFVKIIFLDAVFLIEMFLRNRSDQGSQIEDRVFTKPGMISHIMFDIMLLENQLPMFILRELFEFAKFEEPLCRFACEFLAYFVCHDFSIDPTYMQTHFSEAEHFVDLVRLCLQRPIEFLSNNVGTIRQDDREAAPNVRNLHQCGITLKPASTNNLLDIKFRSGTLEIPKLTITNMAIHLLRNLRVFELLHCDTNYINDYHILLHRLLSTPEDVELLIQAEVIQNRVLDSGGLSKLCRELNADARVKIDFFYYSGLVKDLQDYTRSKRHKWTAMLLQNYFSNPWVSISVIAAGLIVVLTIVQTAFSIKGPLA